MKKICEHCRNLFAAKKSKQKFCSLVCRYSHPRSAEWRAKLAVWSGKKFSDEHCQSMSTGNFGKTMSSEARAKIALSKIGSRNPQWISDRKEQMSKARMMRTMRNMLHRVLRGVKKERTHILLGYKPEQLREHLEKLWSPGMNWENYGNRKGQWNIDHTKPISCFSSKASPFEINSLQNLCPMWAFENFSKHNKVLTCR